MNGNLDHRVDKLEKLADETQKTFLVIHPGEDVEEKKAEYRRINGYDPTITIISHIPRPNRGGNK